MSSASRSKGLVRALWSREAVPYWLVFGVALTVRLLHHEFMRTNSPLYCFFLPGGDSHGFDRWALEIAQTFWLGWDRLPFYQGPLYPYFLAMVYLRFGHNPTAALLAQHFLGALSVLLVYSLGRRAFGKTVAWMSGLAAAFTPLYLLFEGEVLSDSLILFTIVLMLRLLVYAADKNTLGAWAWCGFVLGLTGLGRPNTLVFVPVAGLWCWAVTSGNRPGTSFAEDAHDSPAREGRSLTAIAPLVVFLAATGLTVAPVTLLNYVSSGKLIPISSNGPIALYIGNAHDATGTYARPLSMVEILKNTTEDEKEIAWMGHLARSIRQHPWSLPRNLLKKACLFWQHGEIPHNVNFYLMRRFSPFLRTPLTFGVLTPLGIVGILLVFARREERRVSNPKVMLTIFMATYFLGFVPCFIVARYRLCVLAVMTPFAAYALVEWVRMVAQAFKQYRRGCHGSDVRVCAKPLAVFLIWCGIELCVQTGDESLLIRWNDHYNLAGAYEWQGRLAEAEQEYAAALELAPEIKALEQARDRVAARAAAGAGPRRP